MLAMMNMSQSIKKIENAQELPFELVLVLILQKTVSLQEVRKFLTQTSTHLQMGWTAVPNSHLLQLAQQAQQFITDSRAKWTAERQKYEANIKSYEERVNQMREICQLPKQATKIQMTSKLKSLLQEKKSLASKKEGKNSQILLAQNDVIQSFLFLLQEINIYQQNEAKYAYSNDSQILKMVDSLLTRLSSKPAQVQVGRYSEDRESQLEGLRKQQQVMWKRLEQIFSYYCKDNNSVGLTFEQYTKSSHTLDLRLFLKYFKDFRFQEANKYRFRTNSITQQFKAQATNGLTLTFSQFCSLHRKMFGLSEIESISKGNSAQLQEQMKKMQEMNSIISDKKAKEILVNIKLKTEDNSMSIESPKLIKYASVEARVYKTKSSKSLETDPSTPISVSLISNRLPRFGTNFIRQVRQQIMNEEKKQDSKKMQRANSLFGLGASKPKQVAVHLPKILKLSNQQISNSGIYESLKHFAKYDYLAQQSRLKNIIGLSVGEDEEFINEYFRSESLSKQERQRELVVNKLVRRQKILQSLAQKQEHCKKYDAAGVEPYMRF